MKTKNKSRKNVKETLEIEEVVRRMRDLDIEKKIGEVRIKTLGDIKRKKRFFTYRRIKK